MKDSEIPQIRERYADTTAVCALIIIIVAMITVFMSFSYDSVLALIAGLVVSGFFFVLGFGLILEALEMKTKALEEIQKQEEAKETRRIQMENYMRSLGEPDYYDSDGIGGYF